MRKFYFLLILFIVQSLLFTNLLAQTFTEIVTNIPDVKDGTVEWGDFDNDDDLDILIIGYDNTSHLSKVFRNDGGGIFTDIDAGLVGLRYSSIDLGDYNNDGNLDILAAGKQNNEWSGIYENEGGGVFSNLDNIALEGIREGTSTWADYDNDGDLDVLIVGYGFSKVYKNNGNETFTEQTGIELLDLYFCSAAWGDYNNDGHLDILMSGSETNAPYTPVTKLYKNNGDNTFTDQESISIVDVYESSVAWGDYDNDGDLDIIISGNQTNEYPYDPTTKIYKNNGDETFTEQVEINLTNIYESSVAWGDYDNDGNLDAFVMGSTNYWPKEPIVKVYKNNGDNTFSDQTTIHITGLYKGTAACGDYDNDGDLDILITGQDSLDNKTTKLYENNINNLNAPPQNPTSTQSNVQGNKSILKWNHSLDDHTPSKALTYNLFISKIKGIENIKASMSNISNGYRKIVQFGDILDTLYTINQLDTGKYYWAVQSIDNSFQGSEFSEIDSFEVTFVNHIFPNEDQIILPQIDGDTLFVHETEIVDNRQWKYSNTSGGPYNHSIPGETDSILIPYFSEFNKYYVVCESTKDGVSLQSNEILINVPILHKDTTLLLANVDRGDADWGDYDNDGDVDLIVTGSRAGEAVSQVYRNDSSSFININAGLMGFINSSVAWGDYNNDGYLDILLVGAEDYNSEKFSKIYKNNTDGTFSEQIEIVLEGVTNGNADWFDINSDGKLDIILSGENNKADAVMHLYKNNGNNTFIEMNSQIKPCYSGDFDMGDYNKDGFQDIITTGFDINGNRHTTLYKNVGEFQFETDTTLDKVSSSTVEFGDYDNDGDLDLIIAGTDYAGFLPKIYRNDSNGIFVNINAEIHESRSGDSKWFDYDNDGDLDVVISGYFESSGSNAVTKLYKNIGNDNFIEETNHILRDVNYSSCSYADYDNDGDADLYVSGGQSDVYERDVYLYTNKSILKNTKPSIPTNLNDTIIGNTVILSWNNAMDYETDTMGLTYNVFIGTTSGSQDIVSSNSNQINGFHKLVRSGNAGADTSITFYNLPIDTLYWSVQTIDNANLASEFAIEHEFKILPGFIRNKIGDIIYTVNGSEIEWGDYDNDNDLDLIVCGEIHDSVGYSIETIFYRNNGNFEFEEIKDIGFVNAIGADIEWCDYNLDNNLDLLICGYDDMSNRFLKLYNNNGDGTFTEQTSISVTESDKYINWGDYNNDGLPDILISGNELKVYKNNGNNTFTLQPITINYNSENKSIWADYDNDGDLDILFNTYSISILENNRDNTFTKKLTIDKAARLGAIDLGDYNNDNYIDFIITGLGQNGDRESSILKNNEGKGFIDIEANLRAIQQGDISWGDFDNDGRLDFIITGNSSTFLTKLYHNEGNDVFSEFETEIPYLGYSAIAWADVDNDGGLDASISGAYESGIWKNNYYKGNTKANAPSNLKSVINGYGIQLNWNRAIDKESTEGGLSYNIRIGTEPGMGDVVNPMADTSGFRKIVNIGNVQYNNSWAMDSLPVGTYYWSAQAIDQSFKGGTWSEEQSFTITRLRPNFTADTVCFGDSTSFADKSLFSGTQIALWHWDFGDGDTSILPNPKYVFPSAGWHQVTLEITDTAGVTQPKTDSVFVKQKPIAGFTINDICYGSAAVVNNTSDFDPLTMDSWRWVYGDEDTVYQQNPGLHYYEKTGNYDIQLKIVAENECSDSITNPIIVAENPVANIFSSTSSFCYGDSLKLNTAYNPNYSYEWKNGTVFLENTDSSIYYAKESGDYKVKITNSLITPGCDAETIEAISIEEYPEIIVPEIESIGESTFCAGDSLLLRVYESSELDFVWKLNGTPVYSGINEYYVKSGIGAFTVDAIHSTTQCVVNSSNSIEVIVNEKPIKPAVSLSRNPEFCEGDSIVLSIEEQAGVSYHWMNGNIEIAEANTNAYVAYESGNYYVDVINTTTACSNRSDTTIVTVTEMPDQPIVSTTNYDISDCPQEKIITLSVNEVSNNYSYQWYWNGKAKEGATESDLADYLEEGSYSVQAINGACINQSDDIDIVYNPELPDKPSIEVKGPAVWYLVCTNDQANEYEWYYENEKVQGADEYIYVPGENMGTYFVRIAEENGCFVSSDAVTIPITGVNDLDPFANLKIYPNPTPGMFTIEMDNEIYGELLTRIFTQNAVEIFNIKYDKITRHFKAQIDLSGQGKGIYIISLLLDKYKAERKLVVE